MKWREHKDLWIDIGNKIRLITNKKRMTVKENEGLKIWTKYMKSKRRLL